MFLKAQKDNHDDDLQNNVDLSDINTFLSEKFKCRICFEEMAENQVIEFCRCKGSNAYIHTVC